jgi:2-amino-4-hydroxy-6-hydroxymethyldihydropteridine diphosphokinase
MSNSQQQSYIALGSNLGNREDYLRSAMAALGQLGEVKAVSSFYETEPVGTVPQPDFLNAVVELWTALPPEQLLTALLRIELEHGRDRNTGPPKGPRTLDLDLLSYGALVLKMPLLTLPHPALVERRFVLAPLAEIAPRWRHPISGKTAMQMLMELQHDAGDGQPTVRQISKTTQSS